MNSNLLRATIISAMITSCGSGTDATSQLDAAPRNPNPTTGIIWNQSGPEIKSYIKTWKPGPSANKSIKIDAKGQCRRLGHGTSRSQGIPIDLAESGLSISFPSGSGQVVSFPTGSGLVVQIPGSAGLEVTIPGNPPLDLSGSNNGPETTVSIPGSNAGVPSVTVSFPEEVSATVSFPLGPVVTRPTIRVNCIPVLNAPPVQ